MSAFKATYSDWKLIKTRGVIQVVMEVPLADADAAYDVLGGMPNPANEQWFGIAPIKSAKEVVKPDAKPEPESPHAPQPARAKRSWKDVPPAEQAFLRCQDIAFISFLKEEWHLEWRQCGDIDPAADCVRLICGVQSRKELATNHAARVIWHQLNDQYEAWMRVGA